MTLGGRASRGAHAAAGCKDRGVFTVHPCRSFCTQVAIQCANNLEYGELCKGIACQAPSIGIDETCTPGPYDDVGVFGCDVYRYNTPSVNAAAGVRASLGALALVVACAVFG